MCTRTVLVIMAVAFGVETSAVRAGAPDATAPDKAAVRVDRYGDPLPDGAIARMGTARLRHTGGIASLAISDDGKTLASVGMDQSLRVWDAATGKEIWSSGFLFQVRSATFSADGKTLATASNAALHLYDAATGKEIRRWPWTGRTFGPFFDGIRLRFSPDGKTLASTYYDPDQIKSVDNGVVQFWELTGKEVRRFKAPEGRVDCLAFSPDGKFLATGAREQAVRIWDVASGKELGHVETKLGHWQSLAFAPDGKSLACVAGWDELLVCEAPSGKTLRTIKADVWPDSILFFRADGRQLALAGEDGRVVFFDADTGKELRRLQVRGVKKSSKSRSPAVSADGKTAAFIGDDDAIVPWDLVADREVCTFEDHSGGGPALVAVSPDGKTVATCGRRIYLWDAATGRLRRKFEDAAYRPTALTFSPDGRSLATGDGDGLVLWDAATGRQVRRIEDRTCSPHCLTFVGGGGLLAVAGPSRGAVTLIDAATGRGVRTLDMETRAVTRLSASPDGKLLAAGAELGFFKLWKVENGEVVRGPFPGSAEPGSAQAFAFSPDGETTNWTFANRLIPCPAQLPAYSNCEGAQLQPGGRHAGYC